MSELQKRTPGAALYSYQRCGHVDRWKLLADIQRRARSGEIERHGPVYQVFDEHGRPAGWEAAYIPLRAPRPRLPRYAAAFTVGMGAVAAVAGMLWHARYVILYTAAGLAALAVLIGALMYFGQHRAGCPGIITHCPGCKG